MLEPFKNFVYHLAMLLKVSIIDDDVIHIDCYFSFSYEVCEHRVHKGLEGGRAVCHAEVHYFRLIQPSVGYYCSLPFVTFTYANIVIPPSDIKFCEVSCLS